MRADRLVAALLYMQGRGRITAAELAAELEVSVATARRDLEALSTAGVPVYPQPGRGGGWSLVGGARTDLSGLTAAEARALFLLAGPAASGALPRRSPPPRSSLARSSATLPGRSPPPRSSLARSSANPELRSALRKLMRALPGPFRAEADAAANAVVVDPARWGEADRTRPDHVDRLQSAVVRRRKVRLTYTARTGGTTERLADPLGLVAKDDIWYLIAGTDRGQRTFRVDRMVDVEVTDARAERPADFDLSAAWERVVDEMERRRSLLSATVLIEARFAPILRDHFGRHFDLERELADGRVRVRVAAPTARDIARQLAGWGALVEVVRPDAVRAELARIGAELASRYATR